LKRDKNQFYVVGSRLPDAYCQGIRVDLALRRNIVYAYFKKPSVELKNYKAPEGNYI
jgi:hypothetical protein